MWVSEIITIYKETVKSLVVDYHQDLVDKDETNMDC